MRQAILDAPHDLRIAEVPVPELEPGEVLVKVDATLLCGTDVRIFTGRKSRNVTFPTVLGHEFAGHIADSNGPLPGHLVMGDRVCIYPLVPCGRCAACRKGHENICRNRVAFGYQLPGGLSQYVRVPANAVQNIVPVPGVSAAEAAIVEPLACAYNGQTLVRSTEAETLLVVGCGPLGLLHIRLARALGIPRVAAVDPIEGRRAIAAASGADLVLAPGEDTAAKIKDWGDGGIDVLIMAIGRSDALTPYLGALAPGARISVFAGFGSEADLVIPANDIHYNEWEIVGASSCRLDDFRAVADLVSTGRIQVDDLVGSQLALDQTVDALDLAASGKDMRVGVDPWN
ncbi:alcohol dehydrogenase catalytic domain-containing protein [Georgenia sp. TF02-10]|uniref:alcohol dehydrogenase catalytic domain-containing protein n=1 Tax=Georgenia sp. TF02-10 TaxID=2917725 RepID=UPI001FA77B5F|nr:alcohol dehydrogenase catalytic domain-containing protein [Georgenia sp. TF02-10]UNX55390.1 alcohol dehydrogenase catalytic domain-containing protein [Georgenia sp. TF02-10]